MKNYLMGFLLAYTILMTWFAYGLYNGKIASIQQACVERVSSADIVNQLERK